MMPFQGLLTVMSKLRFKDETALRGLGLAKLIRTYDAYPVQEGGKRLYCLIPRGVPLATAMRFEKETAARQIIVLEKGEAGIQKVWPSSKVSSLPSEPEKVAKEPEKAEDLLKFVDE